MGIVWRLKKQFLVTAWAHGCFLFLSFHILVNWYHQYVNSNCFLKSRANLLSKIKVTAWASQPHLSSLRPLLRPMKAQRLLVHPHPEPPHWSDHLTGGVCEPAEVERRRGDGGWRPCVSRRGARGLDEGAKRRRLRLRGRTTGSRAELQPTTTLGPGWPAAGSITAARRGAGGRWPGRSRLQRWPCSRRPIDAVHAVLLPGAATRGRRRSLLLGGSRVRGGAPALPLPGQEREAAGARVHGPRRLPPLHSAWPAQPHCPLHGHRHQVPRCLDAQRPRGPRPRRARRGHRSPRAAPPRLLWDRPRRPAWLAGCFRGWWEMEA